MRRLNDLREEERKRCCDVEIEVGSGEKVLATYKAQKIVLAVACPFYSKRFKQEKTANCVKVDTDEVELVKRVLDFLHTGKAVLINEENAYSLFELTNFLNLLNELIRNFIFDNPSVENFVEKHYFAKNHQWDELAKAAWATIMEHPSKVMRTESFLNLGSTRLWREYQLMTSM